MQTEEPVLFDQKRETGGRKLGEKISCLGMKRQEVADRGGDKSSRNQCRFFNCRDEKRGCSKPLLLSAFPIKEG